MKLRCVLVVLLAGVAVFGQSLLYNNGGTTTAGALSSVGARATRSGSVAVAVIDTTKTLTFSSAMADTNYEVFFQPNSSVAVALWVSAKTLTNCVLNLSLGVNATISYAVISN
jgi:hypothetical protein